MVGLFFFLRAATKDRTETLVLPVSGSAESSLETLTTYLQGRAYQVHRVDADQATLTLQG
ncbi:MAG TPA: cofactor assembly of complex C subunit B, partial [Leptolyngbyaceae cyanobacterium M65_K2018_010]|nr:cofactor assembly of complex C subunit B [Leptolyngbyaceae cyanobacterium M65_K2018_010]